MTRRKNGPVRIRVLTSFNGMVRKDEADVHLSARVQGWIDAGLVEVVDGGKDQARPGGTEPATDGGVPFGAGGGSTAGGEPGPGFGAGGYGASES